MRGGERVAGNGGAGIELDGTTSVALERNLVHDNGSCGYRFVDANLTEGAALVAPVLTVGHLEVGLSTSGLTGTFAAPGGAYEVVRIDVFYDPDGGAEHGVYVGEAEVDEAGGTWTLEASPTGPVPDPLDGRVSAVLTVGVPSGGGHTDVRSSDAGSFCGDGCAAVGTGPCLLGDPCQEYDCDASDACVFTSDNDDALCLDGDACTESDTCQGGVCVEGARGLRALRRPAGRGDDARQQVVRNLGEELHLVGDQVSSSAAAVLSDVKDALTCVRMYVDRAKLEQRSGEIGEPERW